MARHFYDPGGQASSVEAARAFSSARSWLTSQAINLRISFLPSCTPEPSGNQSLARA